MVGRNRRIAREGWRGAAEDYVLAGSETERTDDVFHRNSQWLREIGWRTQKTNHALRAYAGSLVAMRENIWRASAWLRHAGVKTTQQAYSHFINSRVFGPQDVRVRWAR